jgi:hypothetical protein
VSNRAPTGFAGAAGAGAFGDSIRGAGDFEVSILDTGAFGVSILGAGASTLGGRVSIGLGASILTAGSAGIAFRVSRPLFELASPAVFEIFVSNSSRTVSCIIAPHVRQMDRVGARSRLQTGHIIGVLSLDWILICKVSATRANRRKNIRGYFKASTVN